MTLIELMIVIVGMLAANAIPNLIAMENRAKEGSVKSHMHTIQLTADDYGIRNDGACASTATEVIGLLPGALTTFKNPFDHTVGTGNARAGQLTCIG